ncbi:ATP-binding protein [Methylobacter sp. BBA5.1]|uniref:ATP-binding protein n=1 Tax=Methylobacter sp. BBA5.1 TaxID=1495064 RepID=UPI000564C261|nr:ATP-binding protein [Methylobacter sp. BBA5.1]
MSTTYQLKSIVLIDSFWAGQTMLLNVDGHTNLSGTNGAGKTTFLRLMQLFWGERPSNIVAGTGSKKSFVDHYLPRASSYLVYEYQRPFGQVCHVMVQSDGRTARYKFIDAPYDRDCYVDENQLPRDSAAVERQYKRNGPVETSRVMGVDDYCSVIQHHHNSGKKWIRTLQRRFSMASSPVTHMEKVIGAVIEKIGDFEVIKQMLVDISRDRLSQNLLDQEQRRNPFQLSKSHIDAWLADINAARALEARRDYFDALLQAAEKLKDTNNELSHIHFLARNSQKSAQAEQEKGIERINEAKAQLQQLKLDFDRHLEPKNEASRQLNGQIKDLDYQINALEDKKQQYEQQDAETFAIKGALLGQYLEQQTLKNEEIEALESKTKDIKAIYEHQLTELKHQHTHQLQAFENQRATEALDREKKLTEAEAQYQQRKEQLVKDSEARTQPLKEQKSQLTTDCAVKQSERQHVPMPEALAQQIEKTRQELAEIRQAIRQAVDGQQAADKAYYAAREAFHDIETRLKNKKAQLRQYQQQHETCLKRLQPAEGSLQHFLEQEVEGWQQTIGRVIAPDLLEHKGLNPTVMPGVEPSFYGLSLDLEALAGRELETTKAALQAEEQALFKKIEEAQADIERTEANLNAASATLEQSRQDQQKAEHHTQRARQQEETLNEQEQGLNHQAKAEIEKARAHIQHTIDVLQAEIKRCDRDLQTIAEESRAGQTQLHQEHLARRAIIESDAQNRLQAIQALIKQEKDGYQTEQKRIQARLQADLKESGADDTIIDLSRQLEELKTKEKQARKFQEQAEHYQLWLDKQWQQHAGLCRQRGECQQQLALLQDEIAQMERDFKAGRERLNSLIHQQEQALQKTQSLLAQLDNTISQLENHPPVIDEALPDYAPDSLQKLAQGLIQQRRSLEKTLLNGRQAIVHLFNTHQRSQLAEAWNQALEAAAEHARDGLEIEQPLKDVLKMVANVKQATSQQIELHAIDVDAFYRHLRNFESIIKSTGALLSKHVSQEKHFAALGEITVTVRSKMSDLDYWHALKQFGDHYGHYREQAELTGDREIPVSLIEAMTALTTLLPADGIKIRHLSLFDIEFTISENGHTKQARNARELKDVSSTGLSYLALITFFTGVTSMLRRESQTVVCWPIDELGDLAPENIEAMMAMLSRQNIRIISASPTADRNVLSLFDRRYLIDRQKLHEVAIPASRLDALLAPITHRETAHV